MSLHATNPRTLPIAALVEMVTLAMRYICNDSSGNQELLTVSYLFMGKSKNYYQKRAHKS